MLQSFAERPERVLTRLDGGPAEARMHISQGERRVVWGLFAVAVGVNIAGYVWNLYEAFGWFGEFLHFYTPLALTLALGVRLYSRGLAEIRERKFILALTVACVGISVGTLWEIAEWGYDRFVPADAILGKTDTIVDLMPDTAGASVAGLVIVLMTRER